AFPSDHSSQLTAFVQNFCTQFHNAFPDGQVSIDLPAVNWGDKFDVANMVNYIDLFLIMGYDYHWSGSEEAGPVAPKNNGQIWVAYDVTRSINYYLDKGIPAEKLALAVPYYGRDWSTNSSSVPSSTTGSSASKTYKAVREEMSNFEHHWDMNASVPYITYQDAGKWHQCWYDDEFSLADKYDLVKMKKLAGIGIWALGYDGSYPNLWEMLAEKFRTGVAKIGYGVFTDMGGPMGNYYNNEDYIFTIAPAGASQIKLVFDEFSTDANDVLVIYDGNIDTGSILATYSGNADVSDTLTAISGIMSFHFVSDNTSTESGWYARWTNQDYVLNVSKETFDIQSLKLFPNPASNYLKAEIKLIKPANLKISILDIHGSLIKQKTMYVNSGSSLIDLSSMISGLKQGNYFINIHSGIYSLSKKIVIIR
ncbi:MAG: glycosyl hydrolase family 18 protein, partial [Bacteroidales bacterium]|nr:glycosyl hydrolase family 18 protein [Bacteroidales bacterium]